MFVNKYIDSPQGEEESKGNRIYSGHRTEESEGNPPLVSALGGSFTPSIIKGISPTLPIQVGHKRTKTVAVVTPTPLQNQSERNQSEIQFPKRKKKINSKILVIYIYIYINIGKI